MNFPLIIIFLTCMVSLQLSQARNHRHMKSRKSRSKNMKKQLMTNLNDISKRKALEHSVIVSEAGSCDLPRPQIVHVSEHYPDPEKYYLPHCTLLHRCGKHAGCCGTDKLKCVVAEKERVTLHFFSVRVTSDGVPDHRVVEKLTFTNHTKCACVPRTDRRIDL